MIPLSNAHTHTHCCDGSAPAEAFVRRALELGFSSIGFSGHAPLPYQNDYAMTTQTEAQYLSEVVAAQHAFRDNIDVVLGVEYDYHSTSGLSPYAYVISAFHDVYENGAAYSVDDTPETLAACIQNVFRGDVWALVDYFYVHSVRAALRPGMHVVAHFDLITKLNRHNRYFDENSARYRAIALSALRKLKDTGLILEVNTGAMSRGYRAAPYPAPFLLEEAAVLHMPVMINSDAHTPDGLNSHFDAAVGLCRRCGIRQIQYVTSGGFVPHAIV